MTLVNVFNIPFYRDYLLGLGVTAVSRQNAIKVLKQNYSICIVIGGAQESLHAKVHKAELILDKRKGFVKLALEVGNVGLVPIFAFGENEIYNVLSTENKSLTRRFQLWMKNRWGFTIPLFYARGIFNYDWGFIPFRHPINLVFGNPIMVPKLENFSEKDVDNYHGLYVKELSRIFNEYKAKFGYNDVELELVA
ncbi:related to diacylglycerol acyltransferase type 2A [Saccharomycodes ludwigii]|uniref:diacylglycerol O-acyltransferase n=2 Tax=Saccharomycodes ludwigii TaxID=36035 RepID=A0A376B1M0_9ASCO|nr:related to diacylglycerol acyltransferase type 2A [Saccharomycodes ludwigii]